MLGKVDYPKKNQVLDAERILYFISGKVKDGKIVTHLDERDWFLSPSDTETAAYYVIAETKLQYRVTRVTIDNKSGKLTSAAGRTINAKKSEMEPIRTPGFNQETGRPIVGMFTFDKNDVKVVHQATREALIGEITEMKLSIQSIQDTLVASV